MRADREIRGHAQVHEVSVGVRGKLVSRGQKSLVRGLQEFRGKQKNFVENPRHFGEEREFQVLYSRD